MVSKRKYFGTDGIRGCVGESLINPEFVLKLGWAMGMVFGNGNGGKVLIGKDTRISGYMLESAMEAGLAAAGMDIRLLGPMPTPAIAYLTRTFRACAGVVISASHNLYYDNGIKIFSNQGFKLPDGMEKTIEDNLEKPIKIVGAEKFGKAIRINDAQGRYIEFCKGTFPYQLSLKGLKIVVDCANGATYRIAPRVFKELGADVVAMGIKPDGININTDCGATKPEKLRNRVLSEKADMGIALDGDGDRLIMVDHKGEVVDGDELLFIMASNYHSKGMLSGGVVGTVMSNLGFEQSLQQLGIEFKRAQVGDRYVMAELQKNGWLLGGESSGHIVHLGLTTTGDGIVTALQILHAILNTERNLHELKSSMRKYPQKLINVPIARRINLTAEPKLSQAVKSAEQQLSKKGRVLLRPSGTEPVFRIMVEGEDAVVVESIAQNLAQIVAQEGQA